MTFAKWIDVFTSEKGLDLESVLEVEGPSGTNWIPVEVVIDAMKSAPASEQAAIKRKIIAIDFHNGSVINFLTFIARAIAL